MDYTKQRRDLYELMLTKSAGNWEELSYKIIDAAKMRNFLKYIAIYGNNISCNQTSVDDIEILLRKNRKYYTWKKENSEGVKLGLSKGFIYLFSHMNSEAGDVEADIEKCLSEAVSVITNVTTGKQSIAK